MQEAVAGVLVEGCGEDCKGVRGEGGGEEVEGGEEGCGRAEAGEVEEVVDLVGSEGWGGWGGHFWRRVVGYVVVV